MPDQHPDPHDEKVKTVPLPSDERGQPDGVIVQENQSAEVALGGGGWPSPGEPPSGPSPGAGSEGSPPDEVGATAGGAGEETEQGGEFPPMKDVLDADPVAGGAQSTPDGDDVDGR